MNTTHLPRAVAGFLSAPLLGWLFLVSSSAEPGLVGEYYNDFKVTDGKIVFDGLNLVKSQVDTNLDNWNASSGYNWDPIGGGNFSVRWRGAFLVPTSGRYGFGTISDDGSQIWIDGVLAVDNGEPQWFDWQEAYMNLGAGYHQIEIDYYDSAVFSGIEVWWLPPTIPESPLPYSGEDFHHVPPTFNAQTQWSALGVQNLSTEPPVPFPKLNVQRRPSQNQVVLSWMSSAQGEYQLEGSTDLLSWSKVGGRIRGTGNLIEAPVAGQPHECFRLLAYPWPVSQR